jgi:hypothetical protein
MTKEQFIIELSKLNPASTFLTLSKYHNAYGEIANYNIVFHISYENALKRSVLILENLVPDSHLQLEAKHELLQSYHQSIHNIKTTPIEAIDDHYTRFFDSNKRYIKGVKMHTATGNFHLYGFINNKFVLKPGSYPLENRSPLTKEKDFLRSKVPVGRFRQFRILPNQVEKIAVQKLSLLPPI